MWHLLEPLHGVCQQWVGLLTPVLALLQTLSRLHCCADRAAPVRDIDDGCLHKLLTLQVWVWMKQARAGHSYHLNYLFILPLWPMACRHYCLLQLRFGAVWLGRNDPELGAKCPRNWGGTTAFGTDVGRIDPGRIDRKPFYTLCSEKKTPTHIFFHISMSDVWI